MVDQHCIYYRLYIMLLEQRGMSFYLSDFKCVNSMNLNNDNSMIMLIC